MPAALDNTLVVVTSDHGEGAGRARRGRARLLRLRVDAARAAGLARAGGDAGNAARQRWRARSICFRRSSSWPGIRRARRTTGAGRSLAAALRGDEDRRGAVVRRVARAAPPLRLERPARGARRPLEVHPRAAAGALRSRPRSGGAEQPGGRGAGARPRAARRARGAAAARSSRRRRADAAAVARFRPELLEKLGALGYVEPRRSDRDARRPAPIRKTSSKTTRR